MSKRCYLLLALLVVCTAVIMGQDKKSISIMPLNAMGGVAESELIGFGIVLESAFTETGKYRVIASSTRDVILKEQAFGMSGCSDQTCAVEVGRLLSADYLIIGSIAKSGEVYIVSINLVSVESGEIEKNALTTLQSVGSFEEMQQKSRQLAEIIAREENVAAAAEPEPVKVKPEPEPITSEEADVVETEVAETELVEAETTIISESRAEDFTKTSDEDLNSRLTEINEALGIEEAQKEKLNITGIVIGITTGAALGGSGYCWWQAADNYASYNATPYQDLAISYRETVNAYTMAGTITGGLFLAAGIAEAIVLGNRSKTIKRIEELQAERFDIVTAMGRAE